MSAVSWLAAATDAEVTGLHVGSQTLDFRPRLAPSQATLGSAVTLQTASSASAAATTTSRNLAGTPEESPIVISASTPAASAPLIFQAILPFLLLADCANGLGPDSDQPSGSQPGAPPPIHLELRGGTHVPFSLSADYLCQVLLPTLRERFGVQVDCSIVRRGWSTGVESSTVANSSTSHATGPGGVLRISVHPLARGQSLSPIHAYPIPWTLFSGHGTAETTEVKSPVDIVRTIAATVLAPSTMLDALASTLAKDLGVLFPDAAIEFPTLEASGHESRVYVLLVASSGAVEAPRVKGEAATATSAATVAERSKLRERVGTGPVVLRWGRDILYTSGKKKLKGGRSASSLAQEVSRKVCKELFEEVNRGGDVDEHLEDQLVVFQAMARGRTSFVSEAAVKTETDNGNRRADERDRGNGNGAKELDDDLARLRIGGPERTRRDRTDEPFGSGSLHTTTARYVASLFLPTSTWYNKGQVCDGAGISQPAGK